MGARSDRRIQTDERLQSLCKKLQTADDIANGKACVYATGSYGRGEASIYSDLDIFIVSKMGPPSEDGQAQRQLSRLDEIRIKSQLIDVTRSLSIKEFSGDGRWLVGYAVEDLTKTLGKPEDDALNTFTARLLLLLESRPLLGSTAYKDVMESVIEPYWKDFDGHEGDFVPAFLANDILRLWRTFCVNYEANTLTEPNHENAKRKSKNYKLKHSRMLTCYSALLYLITIFGRHDTVTRSDVIEMTRMTPAERLDWILLQSDVIKAHAAVRKLLEQYELFLDKTNVSDEELIQVFLDKTLGRTYMKSANEFGQLVLNCLRS